MNDRSTPKGAPVSTGVPARTGAQSTVRATPRAYADDATLHRLALAGYRITTACRSCGAPLVDPHSVAAGIGPVCAKRVVSNG